MAHIVDATPSSSAGAAQLFAAAAALEDGLEDVTDYSSINRWEAIFGTRAKILWENLSLFHWIGNIDSSNRSFFSLVNKAYFHFFCSL
jgi:hypothetical protein